MRDEKLKNSPSMPTARVCCEDKADRGEVVEMGVNGEKLCWHIVRDQKVSNTCCVLYLYSIKVPHTNEYCRLHPTS